MSLQPFTISGYKAGLQKNTKPFLILDSAFQQLENAYVWRESVKKREGVKLAGRLRRLFTTQAAGTVNVGAGTTTFSLFTQLSITGEPNSTIEPGNFTTITLTFGAPFSQTLTDSTGTGVLTGFAAPITGATINYATGTVRIINSGAAFGVSALTATVAYYPNLPVMGIDSRELAAVNVEQTVVFDTKYVYDYDGDDFDSPSTTTWAGDDAEFFWMANYRGITPDVRLFFVTNFANPASNANNRIRHTSDLATWTDFTPPIDSTNSIFQTKIIVPYYGRLLFLNTFEGPTAGTSSNFFNRCRFSQVGDPLDASAWRSDEFGRGGFIDAPTNEAIISARFYKNTLIIFFERTTWQLRYVGEYGLPFLWERISSDFGSESTFSSVLFDSGILAVGDKAIIASSGNNVQRIDLDIPDTVFEFHNQDDGKERVHGFRDYQKEIVYWCYSDGGLKRKFPNRTLLYNYRNNTWASFRDNVTAFGILTNVSGDLWDLPIEWDSSTPWDTFYQGEFPTIISGNQQGFIHYYQFVLDPDPTSDHLVPLMEHESLYIKDITRSTTANLRLEVPDHNLENGEIIYIAGLNFVDITTGTVVATNLNDRLYYVIRVDDDNIDLNVWDQELELYSSTAHDDFAYTPAPGTGTHHGGGVIALFPKLNIVTKDFNPFGEKGHQFKSSYIDFQTDGTPNALVTVNISVNSALAFNANMPIYNTSMETSWNQQGNVLAATNGNPCQITSTNHGLQTGRIVTFSNVGGMTELNGTLLTVTVVDLNTFTVNVNSTGFGTYTFGGEWFTQDRNPYYISGSNYSWHRFYSNVFGQYLTYKITYSDLLMNSLITHNSDFQMNAMTLWGKPGGRNVP
jgi:hypothetical protein